MAEQRNNQSEFSFELEELSIKFAGIKEPAEKVKPVYDLFIKIIFLRRLFFRKKVPETESRTVW
jgi:hypothetical protein